MHRRFSPLVVGCSVFVMAGMLDTILGPTYQFLAARFGVKLAEVGMFTAFQFAGAVIGSIVGGGWLTHWTVRRVYSYGLGMGALGAALLFISPVPVTAFAAVFLIGLALGVLNTAPILVISAMAGADGAHQMNLLNAFFGMGAALTPALVAALLVLGNPVLVYLIITIGCLIALVPSWQEGYCLDNRPSDDPEDSHAMSLLLGLVPFCLFLFLYVGVEVSVGSWLTVQVSLASGTSTILGAISASFFWIGLTVGRFSGSLVMTRWQDERRLLMCALSGLLLGVVLILLGQGPVAVFGAILAGVGCGPIFPTTFAFAARSNPALRGQVAGLFMAGAILGAAVLPYIQGRIGGGNSGGMEVSLGVIVILFLLFLGVLRRTPLVARKPLPAGGRV
ncbi:MAG: MFS transporter [Anaerolineae bacterium]|nr:MFS transporter [Anaerolineae bacterium]